MPGFVAMVSVMAVVSIEMFFATRGAGHSHSHDMDYSSISMSRRGSVVGHMGGGDTNEDQAAFKRYRQGEIGSPDLAQKSNGRNMEPTSHSYFTTKEQPESDLSQSERAPFCEDAPSDSELDLDELDDPVSASSTRTPNNHHKQTRDDINRDVERAWSMQSRTDTPGLSTTDATAEQQKMLLQCLLLEAGILFHSIFIGMALSVATGTAFVVLLVAISFHQTFEGLALGSRIAAITAFGPRSPKPWFMALAYGTTTPVGQAIGLVLHNLYDPRSQTGLIMVGFTNAISSGLLLFAGLVELLAEDFLSDKSYVVLKGWQRMEAWGAVFAGSMLMAFVGAWA